MRAGFIPGSMLQIFLIHFVNGAGIGRLAAFGFFAAEWAAVTAVKFNHDKKSPWKAGDPAGNEREKCCGHLQ
jgi:hypothetical protein